MNEKLLIRFFVSQSDNRKSKTCPELCRRIENLKWARLSVIAFVLVVAGAASLPLTRLSPCPLTCDPGRPLVKVLEDLTRGWRYHG